MMVTDTSGASKLLDVSRKTIWLWRKTNILKGSISMGWKTLIPLSEIAYKLNTTQKEVIAQANYLGVPIWRVEI